MNNHQFKVGEIAIVQNSCFPFLNGTECEVLEIGLSFFIFGMECNYRIKCIDGNEYWAGAIHLRRKRPPQSDTGELRILELFKRPPIARPELEPA